MEWRKYVSIHRTVQKQAYSVGSKEYKILQWIQRKRRFRGAGQGYGNDLRRLCKEVHQSAFLFKGRKSKNTEQPWYWKVSVRPIIILRNKISQIPVSMNLWMVILPWNTSLFPAVLCNLFSNFLECETHTHGIFLMWSIVVISHRPGSSSFPGLVYHLLHNPTFQVVHAGQQNEWFFS